MSMLSWDEVEIMDCAAELLATDSDDDLLRLIG